MPSMAEPDVVASPLEYVHAIFQAAASDASKLESGAGWSTAQKVDEAIARAGGLDRVPALDAVPVEQLRPGTLVRFQGMVQDMWDPEYYLGVYEEVEEATGQSVLRTGKYLDQVEARPGWAVRPPQDPRARGRGGHGIMYGRTPLYVVPVPALSDWAREARASRCPRPHVMSVVRDGGARTGKRSGREEDQEDMDTAHMPPPLPRAVGNDAAAAMDIGAAMGATAKRAAPDLSAGGASLAVGGAGHGLGLGFKYAGSKACVVKVYDEEELAAHAGPLKVSDVVEFLGVLSLEHDGCGDEETHQHAPGMVDERAHRPPSCVVPRLHCLAYRRVGGRPNALVPPAADAAARQALVAEARATVPALRAAAVEALRRATGGDALCAELLLLSALSKVTARDGPDGGAKAVGHLALNLQVPTTPGGALNATIASAVEGALRYLCPVVRGLRVDGTSLNAAAWAPARDVQVTNQIAAAPLQLPPHAILVADETPMAPAQLSERGVANLAALADVAVKQMVPYDFGFYKLDFAVDVALVLVSRGKSLLPGADLLPLPVGEGPSDVAAAVRSVAEALQLAPGGADAVRAYLTLAGELDTAIGEEVTRRAQDDFVAARQADPSVGVNTLHTWCTLVRLIAQSELATEPTEAHWTRMRAIEEERMRRVRTRMAEKRGAGVAV